MKEEAQQVPWGTCRMKWTICKQTIIPRTKQEDRNVIFTYFKFLLYNDINERSLFQNFDILKLSDSESSLELT